MNWTVKISEKVKFWNASRWAEGMNEYREKRKGMRLQDEIHFFSRREKECRPQKDKSWIEKIGNEMFHLKHDNLTDNI